MSKRFHIFWGCMANYKLSQIKEALLEICRRSKSEYTTFGEKEVCCGFPLLSAGLDSSVASLAKYNVNRIRKSATKVVTPCPGCYSAFKLYYPSIVGNLGFGVLHHSEFLYELIRNGEIEVRGRELPKPLGIAYHDPCQLVNTGIIETPRKILESLPEIKLMEFLHNREESRCCGGGDGVVWNVYPRLSLSMGEDRVKEALSMGADSIVTACPLCINCLSLASRRLKAGIKIVDISSFLLKWLK